MKTNKLILKNGLLTLLMIVSLSLNSFVSAQANEITAFSGVSKSHETKSLTVPMGLTVPVAASKEDVFTETLKNWMESGLYWTSINATESENREISDEILQTKVSDKTMTISEVGTELFNSLKTWMQNGFYWDKMDE